MLLYQKYENVRDTLIGFVSRKNDW